MKNSGSILAVPRTASYFSTILAVLLMTSCTICRADQDNIRADVTSDTLKSAEGRGLSGDMFQELVSRLPMGDLLNLGLKAVGRMANARTWPAGLTSLVVGTAPTTGAIVGVISISIFVIVIWLVIYSIGVLPVGSALSGRDDDASSYPSQGGDLTDYQPFLYSNPYPYNQRFQRSLAQASQSVMNAMDQFQSKQN